MRFNIPDEKKKRVIINTDAKNEVDDQFAIVHALLSESFEIEGIISAHFGEEKSKNSEMESYEEIMKLFNLMEFENRPKVYHGAAHAMSEEKQQVVSEGSELIIREALRDDDRTLYIAFLGPLTDMAAALLTNPSIAEKDIVVIWIGGGKWHDGGAEYNLHNDIIAANTVFESKITLWQVPKNVYGMMPVSFAELYKKVYPCGEIGKYLTKNVIEFNNAGPRKPGEFRVLGDSPAIGLIMYPECGEWKNCYAPFIDKDMNYVHNKSQREIRVYSNINSRFILEDFYAKLALYTG